MYPAFSSAELVAAVFTLTLQLNSRRRGGKESHVGAPPGAFFLSIHLIALVGEVTLTQREPLNIFVNILNKHTRIFKESSLAALPYR